MGVCVSWNQLSNELKLTCIRNIETEDMSLSLSDFLSYAMSFMSVPLETEVQERIFYDRRITTVVDKDRDANHEALFRLKEHMDRENEMLRSVGDIHIRAVNGTVKCREVPLTALLHSATRSS